MKVYIDCGAHVGEGLEEFANDCERIYAFEPDPKTFEKLKEKQGLRPVFFPRCQAVWIEDGVVDFYRSTKDSTRSTLMAEKISGAVDFKNPIKVDAINFGKFLKDNFLPTDYVIVKMDIEGAEYRVINSMIKDGSIDLVDEMLVEFHLAKVGKTNEETSALIKGLLVRGIKVALWDKLEQRLCA